MVPNVRDASVIGHIWELVAGLSLYYFFLVSYVGLDEKLVTR